MIIIVLETFELLEFSFEQIKTDVCFHGGRRFFFLLLLLLSLFCCLFVVVFRPRPVVGTRRYAVDKTNENLIEEKKKPIRNFNENSCKKVRKKIH